MNTNGNINNNTDDENTRNTRLGITILSKYFEYISFLCFQGSNSSPRTRRGVTVSSIASSIAYNIAAKRSCLFQR